MSSQPKITIIMPTYNRKPYIAQALQSIFAQKTTYPYQIIVADDCSSDGTLDIVRDFQAQYPNQIQILESSCNQKLFKNIVRAYAITTTDYFCVLDPDDFWIDENKIQKALDFLEANTNYVIYSANTKFQYDNPQSCNGQTLWTTCNTQKTSNFEDYIIRQNALLGHTSSCIFRNVIFKNGVPPQLTTLHSPSCEVSYRGDSFRNLIHLAHGDVFFTPEVDSVYRITDDGIWQSMNEGRQILSNCMFYKDMWIFFDKQYESLLYFSYRLYKKLLQTKYFDMLFQNTQEKFLDDMQKVYELHNLYATHMQVLDELAMQETIRNRATIKFKYRVMQSAHSWLHRKLTRKGLLE